MYFFPLNEIQSEVRIKWNPLYRLSSSPIKMYDGVLSSKEFGKKTINTLNSGELTTYYRVCDTVINNIDIFR